MFDYLTPDDFKRSSSNHAEEMEKGRGEMNMENQTHLNAVGEITELIYAATHEGEE
ncbi:hypothetical protein [Neobacillus sp. B4I6]|uniref:hypothetical protein n=1 Tax=Neobacillus sp. B4I6 TaxID=3373925 RepID=UPI003D1F6E9B